jgi:hypothetical protein
MNNTIWTRTKNDAAKETGDEEAIKVESDEMNDFYGRRLQSSGPLASLNKPKVDFTLTLPEYPYNVRLASKSRTERHGDFPDLPFLQFFTWKASFHIVPVSEGGPGSGDGDAQVADGLRRCHITDQRGDKCGSIVIDAEWLQGQQPTVHATENGATTIDGATNGVKETAADTTEFEFIAISEAMAFTKDEFPDWTYYIPKERAESEWDLFFVLLVEYYPVEGFYRRVALGKVFKAAFELSNDEWSEIILG